MSGDEPARLPPGVDLTELAGLVAPLLDSRPDADALAEHVAGVVVAALAPLIERIELAAAQERRRLGPFVPPPKSTPN